MERLAWSAVLRPSSISCTVHGITSVAHTPLASSQTVYVLSWDLKAHAIAPFSLQCKWHCVFEYVSHTCVPWMYEYHECMCMQMCTCVQMCKELCMCVCAFAMPSLLIYSSISTVHLCFPSLPVHQAQLLHCSTHCTILVRPTMPCIRKRAIWRKPTTFVIHDGKLFFQKQKKKARDGTKVRANL